MMSKVGAVVAPDTAPAPVLGDVCAPTGAGGLVPDMQAVRLGALT